MSTFDQEDVPHVAVAVLGAGPVGLTAALDLHQHGIDAVLFDQNDGVCEGSRAIAWAQRTLEIFDRLGVGEAMRERGVTWKTGKVFWRDRLAYEFDLQPEGDVRFPAFVNMAQFDVERLLVSRLEKVGRAPRLSHRLLEIGERDGRTLLSFETPEGARSCTCDALIAADGARSTVRRLLGLAFVGQSFEDKFLIADVRMANEFPTERWFWFDPPFNPGESALLHRQPDGVWRIDLQLGAAADPQREREPDRVRTRVAAMLGPDRPFELDWLSVYSFHCRRLERFRKGAVFFVGDAAHQISPFGGRGGNSGIQDVDNLVWKLALVLRGEAKEDLLDSYDDERAQAADENMLITSRSMAFISPREKSGRVLRDAVLELATHHEFARSLVNSGRLSKPTHYAASRLNGPGDCIEGGVAPGSPCLDAPLARKDGSEAWLLREIGSVWTLLVFAGDDPTEAARIIAEAKAEASGYDGVLKIVAIGGTDAAEFGDPRGVAVARYGAEPGTTYVIRPDQHVLARYHRLERGHMRKALAFVRTGVPRSPPRDANSEVPLVA